MNTTIALVSISAFLGFAIKYIDEVFDENRFSKPIAYLLAPIATILLVYLLITDFYLRQLVLAVLLALLIARKIDNWVFQSICAAVLGLGWIYHLAIAPLAIDWKLITIAAIAGIIDEIGNDLVEKRNYNCFVTSFFQHRWAMKTIVLGCGWVNLLPISHVVAFLVFDGAYETVSSASELDFVTSSPHILRS